MPTNEAVLQSLDLPNTIITQLQTAMGEEFQIVKNKFLTAVFNKISRMVADTLDFADPFSKYYGESIMYGDTIENIWVETPEGYDFNANTNKVESGGSPFKKALPSVKTLYSTINYQMQYKTTVSDVEMRRAVMTPDGLSNLINKIIGSLPVSGRLNRYFATIAMLADEGIYADGIESLTYTAGEEGKTITEKIVEVGTDFALPSSDNNKLGVMNVTPKDRVLLVIKQELLNKVNLDYLAGVYNLSKVDLINNIIPVKSFSVSYKTDVGATAQTPDNIDFILIDTKGLELRNALSDGGLLYNPEELYTNHYYNDWDIIGYKYFYNARAYKLATA